MDFITVVYYSLIFLGIYHITLFSLIYLQNRKHIFEIIKPEKEYSLSIVVPCYNEEKTIARTIKNLVKSDYPGLKKVIAVDDCSTDNSYKIMKELERIYPILQVVQTPKNKGRAAGAKNYGAKFVDTELIGFSDADSFPKEDAISNMVGFFNDQKVGAVTSRVLVRNKENFLAKIQAVEYRIIAFTRKLFGFIEAIYVTNGPLSIYRKTGFDHVGGFNEDNLTEDIEITWNFVKHGWNVRISLLSLVYTDVPTTVKTWFKQRIRWSVGGLQTVKSYRRIAFKCGMLGIFIWPYFTLAWILGIAGLILFLYRMGRYLVINYLATNYSIAAKTAIIRFNDISLVPSVLFYFGMTLLVLGVAYNLIAMRHSPEKSKEFKNENLFSFIGYTFVYLLFQTLVQIIAGFKYARGYKKW